MCLHEVIKPVPISSFNFTKEIINFLKTKKTTTSKTDQDLLRAEISWGGGELPEQL